MNRTMIGLVAVFTNNFVTCRRIVQENVVRPSVKIVSCKQAVKLTAVSIKNNKEVKK